MNEKYALFLGDNYYPTGGALDFAGVFDDVDSAVQFAESSDSQIWDWAHIARLSDMQIVKHFCDESDDDDEHAWRDGRPNDG